MAVTPQEAPTIERARLIVDRLIASHASIDTVLLCGSVARGDADPWSDIDLVVVGCDAELTTEKLRKTLADPQGRVSMIYYTASEFHSLIREGPLFMIHLKNEGIALFDRVGIREALASLSFSSGEIREQIKVQTAKLRVYVDSRRFNNNFLFCLSHLYTIGKAIVMLGLANRGLLEFNRDAAFDRFAALNPDLASETQRVAQLRPFYRLVAGRKPEPLPFPYRSAARNMQEAIHAIRIIAKRAEQV